MAENIFIYLFVGFALGMVVGGPVGYFAGKRSISITMKGAIGILVAVVWLIGMILSFINPAFQLPAIVHGIFGGIVTSLYGVDALTAINKKS